MFRFVFTNKHHIYSYYYKVLTNIVFRFTDKMKITFAVALVITVFCEVSSQQCFRPYSESQPNKNAHADLYSGQQEFSLALLNAINKVMPNENLFFSPYSTYHALLIAYFLSGGQTESYLKKVLRLKESQVRNMTKYAEEY